MKPTLSGDTNVRDDQSKASSSTSTVQLHKPKNTLLEVGPRNDTFSPPPQLLSACDRHS